MKTVLGGIKTRVAECLVDIGAYKKGEEYNVFVQYMTDTKGMSMWETNYKKPNYKAFESPSELLQYFKFSTRVEEAIQGIEEYGVTNDIV